MIKTRVFCKTSPQTFETRNNFFLEGTSTPVRVSQNFRMSTAALQFRCTNIFCGLKFSAKSPNSPTFVTLQKYPFKRTWKNLKKWKATFLSFRLNYFVGCPSSGPLPKLNFNVNRALQNEVVCAERYETMNNSISSSNKLCHIQHHDSGEKLG